jgi:ATP-dependent protease HslVU (ClpYQ) peptidase subunit
MRAQSPYRELKYSDWGIGVSICVAVACNNRRSIVCVSDGKADFGDFSADGVALKIHLLGPDCLAMFAGNDSEYAEVVLDRARKRCYSGNPKRPKFCGPELAALYIHESYLELLQTQIENKVLRRHGYTLQSFREKGKESLTPEVFSSFHQRIEQVKISLRFMICGFEETTFKKRLPSPKIYTVSGVETPEDRSDIGMWAIGSGNQLAMSALTFARDNRGLGNNTPLPHGIYSALEAKFMAESNNLVGQSTTTIILEPGRLIAVREYEANRIRKIWKRSGAPRIPKRITNLIPAKLFDVRVEQDKK